MKVALGALAALSSALVTDAAALPSSETPCLPSAERVCLPSGPTTPNPPANQNAPSPPDLEKVENLSVVLIKNANTVSKDYGYSYHIYPLYAGTSKWNPCYGRAPEAQNIRSKAQIGEHDIWTAPFLDGEMSFNNSASNVAAGRAGAKYRSNGMGPGWLQFPDGTKFDCKEDEDRKKRSATTYCTADSGKEYLYHRIAGCVFH